MDQMISRSDFFALSLQLHRNFFLQPFNKRGRYQKRAGATKQQNGN